MVNTDKKPKPPALVTTPGLAPQPQINFSHDNTRVSAVLPTGESVEVLLKGATVISWKDRAGNEKLFVSDAANLNPVKSYEEGKAVRGGIPIVFPYFGPAPEHIVNAAKAGQYPDDKPPQHGFARTVLWEFMGSSTSESMSSTSDASVKLDFSLSSNKLPPQYRAWFPHPFFAIYSVTLTAEGLDTGIDITNGETMGLGPVNDESFQCQALLHTYLRVKDITQVEVEGLENASYIDKVDGAKTKTQSGSVAITGQTDRVYTPIKAPEEPIVIKEGGVPAFSIVRDNFKDVVVWNPWTEGAAGMGDFEPKEGYKNMICVEAGSVSEWIKLEPQDKLISSQFISY